MGIALLPFYNIAQEMTPREFDALVNIALKTIPAAFRRRLENVAFVVEKEPPRPGLLGLYQGRPLTLRSVSDSFCLPDKITIYQGPHERMARNREHLKTLLEETVWHEVAHYFGMDETRVRRAERSRAGLLRRARARQFRPPEA
jgi:predicted Zn-dependent protease with MMP-like domain